MLSVQAAQELVLRNASRLPPASATLSHALLGLTLAEAITSPLDSPPFAKALVDGYAVRCEDGTVARRVIEEVVAGQVPRIPLSTGHATRIMTGAPLPEGADAVVMQERTELRPEGFVALQESPRPGQNIMPRGREMRRGETVLAPGKPLQPQHLGLLATLGRTSVQIVARPRVAILATGDELVEPELDPGPGQIRNSNGPLLMGLTARAGGTPVYLGIASDDAEKLKQLVARGLEADVLLLSGGVSAGKLDLVPAVLEAEGVNPVFHKVFMKPGKPLFLGTLGRRLVFGLPGNPVSTFAGFELFVRPALRALMGYDDPLPRVVTARLQQAHRHQSDRPTYHPAVLGEDAGGRWTRPVPWFGSPDLRAVCAADGLCVFEAGTRDFAAGEKVPVLLLE